VREALALAGLAVPLLACASATARPPVMADASRSRPGPADALEPVPAAALTVTSGDVRPAAGDGLAIRAPVVRAVAEGRGRGDVELAFVYRGPSHDLVPLASGEARRQIGLKLRALDGCNLLYVMWHIEPTTGIHVALKSNPGQRGAECGDRGYRTLAPTWSSAVPPVRVGDRRTLRATIERDEMRVTADGVLVWRGRLPPEALALDGPVGLRSDNGEFDLELRAPLSRAEEAAR
jgi:hypothetical protein